MSRRRAGRRHAAEIARALFRTAVTRLPIRVGCPAAGVSAPGLSAAPVMVVHNPAAFFTRLGAGGLIGFGESYLAGDWDCADLTGLLTVFAAHVGDLVPRRSSGCARSPCAASRPSTHRPGTAPAATSAATMTCPTSSSPCSSTRP